MSESQRGKVKMALPYQKLDDQPQSVTRFQQ